VTGQTQPNDHDDARRPLAAVILAAGRGTRMPGSRPKVAYEVAGRPMVCWVVDACRRTGADPIVLVVGYKADEVRAIFAADNGDLRYVTQPAQRGTGDAVACAVEALAGFEGDVLVLAGDGPLIRPATLRDLVAHHRATAAAATLATAVIEDPAGYGRVVRDAQGGFEAIVEHADADESQRAIHEIYPSYACFDARMLRATLPALRADAASGEYRITDVPALLRAAGERVELVDGMPAKDVLSINTPQQLHEVEAILSARMEDGA
jgi:UDP-N-acetylglucosamine diphosphorylase/glucosamine-1-phosphate N-acetyltransferase